MPDPEQIRLLAAGEFWLATAMVTGFALAGLFFGFRFLRRSRLIEDTPTARIRSAPQGYVELEGRVEAPETGNLSAPLTGSPCCWFSYRIEKRHNKSWRTLEQGRSDAPFLLRDETGVCRVEPAGAEVTPGDRSVWHGRSRHPEGRPPAGRGLSLRIQGIQIGLSGTRYRYTEERIRPGDSLYALGAFRSEGELEHREERRVMARELLREWKRAPGVLTARFDRNGDGSVDPQEWELAREAAEREAAITHRTLARLRVPHTLADTGTARRPYLLSGLPQRELTRRLRVFAVLGLTAFFLGGCVSVWLLASRLS